MSLRILVTGAAGFIGSHTVDQLLIEGHTVCGVDNLRTGRRENLSLALLDYRFIFCELDVTEESDLIDLVGKFRPDAIVHLAALVSVPESIAKPGLNDRLNLQATRIVANAALQHLVPRIVFASSAAVYGDPKSTPIYEDAPKNPLSPYGIAKLASEDLLLSSIEGHCFVARCQRYFNVFGPRQDPSSPYSGVISLFLDCALKNHPPTIFGDGGQTRDFISVHDVARANTIAATKPGLKNGVVNICTGRATSINTLWALIARENGCGLDPTYAPARPGDIRHSQGSPNQAFNTLGFQPEVVLKTSLRKLATTT